MRLGQSFSSRGVLYGNTSPEIKIQIFCKVEKWGREFEPGRETGIGVFAQLDPDPLFKKHDQNQKPQNQNQSQTKTNFTKKPNKPKNQLSQISQEAKSQTKTKKNQEAE